MKRRNLTNHMSFPHAFSGNPELDLYPGSLPESSNRGSGPPIKAFGGDKSCRFGDDKSKSSSNTKGWNFAYVILFFLFLSGTAWAAPARECDNLAEDLSGAIEEYKSIDRGVSDYDVVLRRDPMQSLLDASGNIVNPAGLHEGLSVQGVVRAPDFRNVLVDGEYYKEGDMIGPYKVLEIKENGFLAADESNNNQQTFVPLYSENSIAAESGGLVSQ